MRRLHYIVVAFSIGGCALAGCKGSATDDAESGGAPGGAGTSGVGGDGGSDTGQIGDAFGPGGAGGECGDPEVIARHTACQIAPDEGTCADRGGEWRTVAGETFCGCFAEDAGCPCTSATECAVGCYAEHPADDTAIDDCAGLAVGRCVGYQVLGHWCTFDDGVATEIYIDPT